MKSTGEVNVRSGESAGPQLRLVGTSCDSGVSMVSSAARQRHASWQAPTHAAALRPQGRQNTPQPPAMTTRAHDPNDSPVSIVGREFTFWASSTRYRNVIGRGRDIADMSPR